jgi:glycerate dehydrogenase
LASIVVLDGFTLNPGDLAWSSLAALGDLTVHDRTPPQLTVARCGSAPIVLTNKVVLDAAALAQLPDLRYVGVLATGYNVVDTAAAAAAGVVVTNVPAYSTASVVQLTFALLLELASGVGRHAGLVRAGRWSAGPDFMFTDGPLTELAGLTLGLIGLGQIGLGVARVAQALGLEVLAHTRTPRPSAGVTLVGLDELLAASDIVSLHCPLTDANRGLIDARAIALMKPGAWLLNTARGPLVNEADLAAALNDGRLAGAALDVLSSEPPAPDNPLLTAPNCLITPHLAWASTAARRRLMAEAVANVAAFLAGTPRNVVS